MSKGRAWKYGLGCAAGLVLVSALEGCASTKITNFDTVVRSDAYSTKRDRYVLEGKNLEGLLRETFTDKANEKLKNIPLIKSYVGGGYAGYAPGVNFWSKMGSWITGNGFSGRKVIIAGKGGEESLRSLKKTVIHEYAHHLVDLECINEEKFNKAYRRMIRENNFMGSVNDIETDIREMNELRLLFGVSKNHERMTIVAHKLILGEKFPDYVNDVYREWIRFPAIEDITEIAKVEEKE